MVFGMAKDFLGWSKWSSHLSNAITIATGIPLMTGAVAGLWAYMSGAGLSVVLVALSVFMMTLWCCIGFLWLRDRAKSEARGPLDCSWGLRVDGAFLNRDFSGVYEWQVSLQLRNVLGWPLKAEVMKTYAEIENIVPNNKMEINLPAVLTAGAVININLPPYGRSILPDKDRYKGRIEITMRYGHPDFGYSRIMTRKLGFEQIIKTTATPGTTGFLFPVPGPIPLILGAYEEELDKPYNN
jgi:hypothetical protein